MPAKVIIPQSQFSLLNAQKSAFTAGLVGCGRMGQRYVHVLSSLNIPLVSICDISEEACSALINASKLQSMPLIFRDLANLLESHVPDMLIVSSTADYHASHAIEAVNHGVSIILLEKPVATSLLSCSEIMLLSSSAETRIAVNHQMRFLPQYTTPKRLLQSPSYGGFSSMHVAAGNFGLAMNGCHYIEAFRFLADEPPFEVSASFDASIFPNPRGHKFQDVSGCIRVTTASGRRLHIDASADQGHGVHVTYMARNGRITVDELTGAMTTVVRSPEHREAPTTRYGMLVEIDQHQIPPVELVESTRAVLQAVLDGDGYPTLADATLAVKTLVAAYHSHRQGGVPVRLSDIADDDPEVFPWA